MKFDTGKSDKGVQSAGSRTIVSFVIEIGVVECVVEVKVGLTVGWSFEKTEGFSKGTYGGLLAPEGWPSAGSDEAIRSCPGKLNIRVAGGFKQQEKRQETY